MSPAESLIRETHRVLAAAGVKVSANWVTKLVREYLRSPVREVNFSHVLAARLSLRDEQRAEMDDDFRELDRLMRLIPATGRHQGRQRRARHITGGPD